MDRSIVGRRVRTSLSSPWKIWVCPILHHVCVCYQHVTDLWCVLTGPGGGVYTLHSRVNWHIEAEFGAEMLAFCVVAGSRWDFRLSVYPRARRFGCGIRKRLRREGHMVLRDYGSPLLKWFPECARAKNKR